MNELYTYLFAWHLDLPVMFGLSISESGYLFLVHRLWRTTGRFDGRALWAWSMGLLVVFVALESPLDSIGETRLLSIHMMQHELLMSIAPPLLLLGLFPRLVVPITRPILKPLLRNRSTHKLLHVLFSPFCLLLVWLILLYGWHVPTLYMLALRSQSMHIVEHVSLLLAGTVFWLPIIEPVPVLTKMRLMAKLRYLALGQAGGIPLVVVLLWSPSLIYSYYAWPSALWHLSATNDQHAAAIVMMGVEMLVALTAAVWVMLRVLAFAAWQEERHRLLSEKTYAPFSQDTLSSSS